MTAAPLAAPLAALAAGGTGGHLFPARALAEALLARGWRVALLTDERGLRIGRDVPGVDAHALTAGTFSTGGLAARLRGLTRFLRGYLEARRLLRRLSPQVVVGFGGYPSLAPGLAAAHQRRRLVLHEQNQVAGLANRILARSAAAIGTSFVPLAGLPAGCRAEIVRVGSPVRAPIVAVGREPYPDPEAEGRVPLLVTGGSQGATAFDSLIPAAVERLGADLRARLSIAQQVRGDLQGVADVYRRCGVTADLQPFFDDMDRRLAAAQLLICRSGASTLAELAAAGRPALLIPYPHSADDHQRGNAEAFAAAGGGWVLPQAGLTPEGLAARLEQLLRDPAALARAAAAARAFALDESAERLADLVTGTQRTPVS